MKKLFQNSLLIALMVSGLLGCAQPSIPTLPTPISEHPSDRMTPSIAGTGLGVTYQRVDDQGQPGDVVFSGVAPTIDARWNGHLPFIYPANQRITARWSAYLQIPTSGKYVFAFPDSIGTAVFLNGQKINANTPVSLESDVDITIHVVTILDNENTDFKVSWAADNMPLRLIDERSTSQASQVMLKSLHTIKTTLNKQAVIGLPTVVLDETFEKPVSETPFALGWQIQIMRNSNGWQPIDYDSMLVSPGRNGSQKALRVRSGVQYAYTDYGRDAQPYYYQQGADYRLSLWTKASVGAICKTQNYLNGSNVTITADITNTNGQFIESFNDFKLDQPRNFFAINIYNNGTDDCFIDDLSLKITKSAPVIPDPSENLITNSEFISSDGISPLSWQITAGAGNRMIMIPGWDGQGTAFGQTYSNTTLSAKQVISASSLKPNTTYVFKSKVKGAYYNLCRVDLQDPSYNGITFVGFSKVDWGQMASYYQTPAVPVDLTLIVVDNSQQSCAIDDVQFGPLVAENVPAQQQSGTIGTAGGSVVLGDSRIDVPAGTFSTDVNVTIERLALPPVAIPSPFVVLGTYKVTATAPVHLRELGIRIAGTNGPVLPDPVTEIYKLENNDWVIEQTGKSQQIFDVLDADLIPDPGQPDVPFTRTYVVTRTSESALTASFASTGGVFNGLYGECPEDKQAYFGTCRAIPAGFGGQSLKALSNPLIPDSFRVLSLQVGNVSAYCTNIQGASPSVNNYNAKLCSLASEQRARNEILNVQKPDIVFVQEMWNGQCQGVSNDPIYDRVCSVFQNGTPTHDSSQQGQIARVFNPNIYTTKCADLSIGGYECIAVRKSIFAFQPQSLNVTSLAEKKAAIANYCADDSKLGVDTGFQGETVTLINPKGEDKTSFDVWNAHLATPFPKLPNPLIPGGIDCRRDQINAVLAAIKTSNRKFLMAGDFNTEYAASFNDSLRLKALASPFVTPIAAEPAVRSGYMITDETQFTAYSLNIVPKKFDHVISNFVDSIPTFANKCVRLGQFRGFDHRSTVCDLLGFDSGKTSAAYSALDTSGQLPTEILSSVGKVTRRGALMPYVQQSGTTVHQFIIPNGIDVRVTLDINCLSAPIASAVKSVPAGQFSPIGVLTYGVFRAYCP